MRWTAVFRPIKDRCSVSAVGGRCTGSADLTFFMVVDVLFLKSNLMGCDSGFFYFLCNPYFPIE